VSSGLAIVGTVFLASAITGAVILVTDLLYGSGTAALLGAICAGILIVLWYVVPLGLRIRQVTGFRDAG
jgi:hypothetical protein